MIKIANIQTYGWETAIRGMRNPMNSWEKSDSMFADFDFEYHDILKSSGPMPNSTYYPDDVHIGPNDLSLMLKLVKAGRDHAKYRRMITATMDILAPLYWWKEFDTYKVGTVANSCSTMHKIMEKEFTLDDFSHEHLDNDESTYYSFEAEELLSSNDVLKVIVGALNEYRKLYNLFKDDPETQKEYWWQIIQLLPSSYNQLRTVQLNYEVLANIYRSRKGHKLDCWNTFCETIETLPYAKELICCNEVLSTFK